MLKLCNWRLLLVFIFEFIFSFVNGQQTGSAKANLNSIVSEIETKLQKDIADDTLGGSISISIVHKDQILWSKAFGYADKENKTLADTSTIYRIASLTKSFTATVMMQLVEQGMIKLDDPIELYLPEIKNLKGYREKNKITFFQLATHTAGLEREPQLETASTSNINDWESKVLECIPATSIKTTPGKKYNYSNIGYAILGLALERVTKKPYIPLITENIFTPLQMKQSFFIVSPNEMDELAKGLVVNSSGKLQEEASAFAHGYGIPAGGIYSTSGDLSKFLMANMGFYSLCKADSRAVMQTGVKPPLTFFQRVGLGALSVFLGRKNKEILRVALHSRYGMGLSVYKYKGTTIIEHAGLVNGYSSQFSFDKNSQYAVVLLRNYPKGKTNLQLFSIELLSKLKKLDK